MFENTATYFGELLMQEGSQGDKKTPTTFLSACGFRDCRGLESFILESGLQHFDNWRIFSGVQKKCFAQGRRIAKLLHPVGKTDVLAVFWPFLYMTAYF